MMLRRKDRWKELQAMAVGSAAAEQQLADRFVKFLVEIGCEDSQASLFAATPMDVVWFFMEKDVEGRTIVHATDCPYLRHGREVADRQCGCPHRLRASTLDSTIGTLCGVFCDLGRTRPWCSKLVTHVIRGK
jgi:hypothetical protein